VTHRNKGTLRNQIKELNYSIWAFSADLSYSMKALCLRRVLPPGNKSSSAPRCSTTATVLLALGALHHTGAWLEWQEEHPGIRGEKDKLR